MKIILKRKSSLNSREKRNEILDRIKNLKRQILIYKHDIQDARFEIKKMEKNMYKSNEVIEDILSINMISRMLFNYHDLLIQTEEKIEKLYNEIGVKKIYRIKKLLK